MERTSEATDPGLTRFRWRLAETIAWCAGRASLADPKNSLRTPALRPAALDVSRDYCRYRWDTRPERQATVDALADERSGPLRQLGRYPDAPAEHLAGGRLLLYDPEGNLFDGAAEEASRGFFDVDNIPPWDTWLCSVIERGQSEGPWKPWLSYLVSWVPPGWVGLAGDGVWINPEVCIHWAADEDTLFTHQLRAAGLLE